MVIQWISQKLTLRLIFTVFSLVEGVKKKLHRFASHAILPPVHLYTFGTILALKSALTLCIQLNKRPQFQLVISVSFPAKIVSTIQQIAAIVTLDGRFMKKRGTATSKLNGYFLSSLHVESHFWLYLQLIIIEKQPTSYTPCYFSYVGQRTQLSLILSFFGSIGR